MPDEDSHLADHARSQTHPKAACAASPPPRHQPATRWIASGWGLGEPPQGGLGASGCRGLSRQVSWNHGLRRGTMKPRRYACPVHTALPPLRLGNMGS